MNSAPHLESLIVLAQQVTAFLESPYKPFLMFLPFVPWAWLVGTKLDKDARYFHLRVEMWNGIHLGAGAAALAMMVFVPIFWVGWPIGMAILAGPILVYWRIRNEAVPEGQRFELTGEGIGAKLAARRQSKASDEAVIQFTGADGTSRHVPLKDDPLFPTHMAVEDLVGPALDVRATSIELAIAKNGCTTAQTVDGIRYKRDPIPAESALRVVDYVKGIAGMDVEDRRRRQTATFKMRGPHGSTELVAITAGSSSGLLFRLEFDRAMRVSKPYDGLGLLPSQVKSLESLTEEHDRHGIMLVGAPAGHGLTTTMYSLVSRHDAYTSNIKTLEREIELRIDGVDHLEWDPTNPDVDYATNVQSILRRDPDVVMLSLVKDRESARVAIEPGMQGPLLYIPQRSGSIQEQVREWVKIVGDVKQATRSLRAVMNQRLLRTLCPNCRQAYQPTAEQLGKLNLPAKNVTQLYRPGGKIQVKNKIENCPVCGGSGYLGQTGVFEVFVVDDDARGLLAGGDLKAALAHARRNKMLYLQEAALAKVASGETTIEEVVRVTAPAKSGGGSSPPARPASVPAG